MSASCSQYKCKKHLHSGKKHLSSAAGSHACLCPEFSNTLAFPPLLFPGSCFVPCLHEPCNSRREQWCIPLAETASGDPITSSFSKLNYFHFKHCPQQTLLSLSISAFQEQCVLTSPMALLAPKAQLHHAVVHTS